MKTQLRTLHNESKTWAMTEPVSGRKPVLALLMRLLCAAALALPVFGGQAGVVFTSLHSFQQPFPNGANPRAGLVQSSDGSCYGTTERGGTGGGGTVFQISTNGALTSLYSFTGGNDGANPQAGLVQGSNGSLYGTTSSTVFKLNVVRAAPVFQAVTVTHRTLSLTWSTEAGGTYQLQWNSDLSSSNWTNLGGVITAAGATLSATDSVTNAPQRFYRLVISP